MNVLKSVEHKFHRYEIRILKDSNYSLIADGHLVRFL